MKRPWKIILTALVVLVVVGIGLTISGIYLAQSDWLREKVRERIIAEAERSTGGRVEIGKFLFDWRTLTAEIDDFVIHGREPVGSPPLLKVEKLVVGLKVISLMARDFDIAATRVESPQLFLSIAADGSTNVPSPKVPDKTEKPAIETILDLKIKEFVVKNGSVEVHSAGSKPKVASYDLAAKNLQSKFNYEPQGPRYSGALSAQAVDLRYGDYRPAQINVDLSVGLEKNRLQFNAAKLSTAASHVELSGELSSFRAPVIAAKYDGEISLAELGSILKLKSRQSGTLQLAGNARYGSGSDYGVTGKFQVRNLSYSQPDIKLSNVRVESAFQADPKAIQLTGLRAALLGGTITGRGAIREFDSYEFAGDLGRFDIARLAAFETSEKLPYDGIIDGPFTLSGRISDRENRRLTASAKVAISPAGSGIPVSGMIEAKYDGAQNQIVIAPSHVAWPNTRLDLNGVLGERMQVVMESRDLSDLLPAAALAGQEAFPVTLKAGAIRFDGSVIGTFQSPRLEGHISGRNFVYSGQLVDSLTADVAAQENGLSVRGASLVYENLRASFQGSVSLRKWKPDDAGPLNASANLQNASAATLLALAGRKDIPLTGTLGATVQLAGTIGNPQATANLTLANGKAYDEPFDRITGKIEYVNGGTEVITAQWRTGRKQVDLNARYQHKPDDLKTGQVHFEIVSNRMALAEIANVKKYEPGLSGSLLVNASGDAAVAKSVPRISALNGDVTLAGVKFEARQLGDLKLTARTEGQYLKVHADSNLAHTDVRADGSWLLDGDYPGSAQITFAKFDIATARQLLMPGQGPASLRFSGGAEGKADINVALLKPETMTAVLEIPQFEAKPEPNGALNQEIADFTIRNTQPIRISFANSVVRVETARFTGLNTDVSLLGSINLKQKDAINLNLNGNVDLSLARTFNPDIDSSGNLLVRVTVRGSLAQPQLGGIADLRNGNLSIAGFPNGLSKANGRIVFDENRATIETLSAQTGGGTVKLDGFAAFGGPFVSFRLGATATAVRVRYPQGVSSVSDANLTWTGSTERSVLGGDVAVHKVTYNQQSDLGSVLSLAGGPAPTQSAPTGLLGGTQFDIRVQTAPDISLQTGLISGLETEASLRLRGTLANPALLGRIVIYSGNIVFLGNKYIINEGTISFFNPVRIEPIVNIDLQTQARGVDVTLSISGPLDKLSVTYRSDPPLQFSDIVGLLATGKTPSDPTIAARQTDTQQSWEQLGASALIGQAIANPVSGRLQRFFGVSRLKIDPLLPGLGGAGASTGGSNPGARLSLEQQLGPNVLFDYVISTNSTSSQVVRVEWAFNKHWSAVTIREENSAFGVDFQYKKRFK